MDADIAEHMESVGSEGEHVGIVDKIACDRIKLTHHDSQADGKHHFLPLSAVASVGDVTLPMTASDAKAHWEEA